MPSCSDEAEILQQLDNFQRQTATIRKALGGGGSSSGGGGLCLAVDTSSGSDWGLPEGTPLRQRPTGLRGGGYTPAVALFDGLPPSPAALAGSRVHAAGGGGYDRHVEHAGHCEHSSRQPAPQQPAGPPAAGQASSRLATSAAVAAERPRSPIGPATRHTKKSAAAAEKASAGAPPTGAAGALHRLKSSRLAAAAALEQQQQQEEAQRLAVQQQQQQLAEQQRIAEAQQRQQEAEEAARTPPPPQLPPDSNAALVAEVRELRSRLLASLQKHAPELAAAAEGAARTSSSSSSFMSRPGVSGVAAAGASPHFLGRWQEEEATSSAPASSWRLAAVPPTATAAVSGSGRSNYRLSDQSGSGLGWPDSLPGAVSAGSSKPRLVADVSSISGIGGGGGRQRWTDYEGSAGGLTPGSLSGGGGASLARLGSLPGVQSDSSLDAFEAHTEALRQQLARL